MSCCGAREYGASISAQAIGTSPTFAIAELDGSATKKIRLTRIAISGTKLTAAAVQDLRLTKLSSISTGGTPVLGVAVPFNSADPAATGVFRAFTVAPAGGGVVIGAIAGAKLLLDVITTLMAPPNLITFDFSSLPANARPTLRNAAEAFALDLNGATPAHAESLDIYAWWTEEPLNA